MSKINDFFAADVERAVMSKLAALANPVAGPAGPKVKPVKTVPQMQESVNPLIPQGTTSSIVNPPPAIAENISVTSTGAPTPPMPGVLF